MRGNADGVKGRGSDCTSGVDFLVDLGFGGGAAVRLDRGRWRDSGKIMNGDAAPVLGLVLGLGLAVRTCWRTSERETEGTGCTELIGGDGLPAKNVRVVLAVRAARGVGAGTAEDRWCYRYCYRHCHRYGYCAVLCFKRQARAGAAATGATGATAGEQLSGWKALIGLLFPHHVCRPHCGGGRHRKLPHCPSHFWDFLAPALKMDGSISQGKRRCQSARRETARPDQDDGCGMMRLTAHGSPAGETCSVSLATVSRLIRRWLGWQAADLKQTTRRMAHATRAWAVLRPSRRLCSSAFCARVPHPWRRLSFLGTRLATGGHWRAGQGRFCQISSGGPRPGRRCERTVYGLSAACRCAVIRCRTLPYAAIRFPSH